MPRRRRVEHDAAVPARAGVVADELEHLGEREQLVEARRRVVEDVGELVEAELRERLLGDAAEPEVRRPEAADRLAEARDRRVRLHLHHLEVLAA